MQLIGDPRRDESTSDIVLQKILGTRPGAREVAQPGKGLVLGVGPHLHRGRAHLPSELRPLSAGWPTERIELKTLTEVLQGELSSQSFAFPARQFTQENLARISTEYLAAVRTHSSPDGPETGRLPDDVPIPYAVVEIRGDWMRLEAFHGEGPSGWIKARTSTEEWSLRRHMPELGFVEGVSGFLASRVRQAAGTSSGEMLRAAEVALRGTSAPKTRRAATRPTSRPCWRARFRARCSGWPPNSAAIATRRLANSRPPPPTCRMPDSAVNLDVISRVDAAFSGGPTREDPRLQASRLMAAVAAEPSNRAFVGNLASIYTLLVKTQPPSGPITWAPLTPEERTDFDQQASELRRLAAR